MGQYENMRQISLDLTCLRHAYENQNLSPSQLIEEVLRRIDDAGDDHVWISRVPIESLKRRVKELEELPKSKISEMPLYGIPFAVKDNIDIAGLATTAGCPEFSYEPEATAHAVKNLLEAGAILIGKTNLDQFATGLVGTRSPYGISRNPFDSRYIPGGSSSGSAVAVSSGLVSFALGTDTAGSGRVPAAFTNIVGLKPYSELVSTHGVVPACRSLDCVCIFSLTCEDSWDIFQVLNVDHEHKLSLNRENIKKKNGNSARNLANGLRVGVPRHEDRKFFDNSEAEALFSDALENFAQLGCELLELEFRPFMEIAKLLYEGPWIAERLVAIQDFYEKNAEAILPETREIIGTAKNFDAADTFRAMYQLEELRVTCQSVWQDIDVIVVPTTGTIYTIEDVLNDPIKLNSNLGYYTNFVNLLNLSALAVPNGFQSNGLPQGITLMAPPFQEDLLCAVGAQFQKHRDLPLGATSAGVPNSGIIFDPRSSDPQELNLVVVGSHLSGEPLNHQLIELNARLVRSVRTSPEYRLFALPDANPPKPGMLRVGPEGGEPIDAEVWALSKTAFATFVANVPSPLVIGTVWLDDGTHEKGFLCEHASLSDAEDITHFGGWRGYRASLGEISAKTV